MGIYLLVFIGGAAAGGPLLGFVDEHAGPRAGMLLAGAVPAVAIALIAARLAHGRTGRTGRKGRFRSGHRHWPRLVRTRRCGSAGVSAGVEAGVGQPGSSTSFPRT